MRELKFRAWNGKEMEFGGFSIHATGALIKDSALGDVFSDAPVMQFTGLQDKNGKDIYEGDIIIHRDTSGSGQPREFGPREVRWYQDSCNFNVTRPTNGVEIEVVGNRYEIDKGE